MKISVIKSVLESIVTNTNPYLEKRDNSSITSHIYISANDGILNIRATDHEIGLSYKISNNLNIEKDGFATANGKKMLDIIKSLKDGEIILETKGNDLFIKQNQSKYKLPMQIAQDFPDFPSIEGKKKFQINAGILSKALKKVSPCIEANNSKIELTGALIDIKKDFTNIVGTDGKRLALFKLDIGVNDEKDEFNFIIPKKALNEIQKLFFEDIEIYYDENIFIAISNNFEFYTKLINGKYPNYIRVIPEAEKTIKLNREIILEGVKAISMLSSTIKITFTSQNINFESVNDDNSEAFTSINYPTGLDENFSMIINNRSILDFLSNIENNDFDLGFNNEDSPFLFQSNDLKTVLMPIHV